MPAQFSMQPLVKVAAGDGSPAWGVVGPAVVPVMVVVVEVVVACTGVAVDGVGVVVVGDDPTVGSEVMVGSGVSTLELGVLTGFVVVAWVMVGVGLVEPCVLSREFTYKKAKFSQRNRFLRLRIS